MDAITAAGLAGAVLMAFANGANDISKSIATLIGAGEADYRRSVVVVSLAAALGGILASSWAVKMTLLFTKGMLSPQAQMHETFALAILGGAVGWLFISTRLGMPVSTTHSIVGSTVLTGLYVFGFDMILWDNVVKKVALPLILSPLLAFGLSFLAYRAIMAFSRKNPGFGLGWAHWVSAVSSGFARGLNDTPKIAALGLTFYFMLDPGQTVAPLWFFILLAVANAAGGILMGLRVTETLAHKVTKMDDREGFAANLATAVMVIATAIKGFPVSTTHVSGSAIIGMGAHNGLASLNKRVVGEILLSWLITVPVAGILGITSYWTLGHFL